MHILVFVVSFYFMPHLKNGADNSYKIILTPHLKLVVNNVFYLLFYKNDTKNNIDEIIRILNTSKKNLIHIKPNRCYERKKKNNLQNGANMRINIK